MVVLIFQCTLFLRLMCFFRNWFLQLSSIQSDALTSSLAFSNSIFLKNCSAIFPSLSRSFSRTMNCFFLKTSLATSAINKSIPVAPELSVSGSVINVDLSTRVILLGSLVVAVVGVSSIVSSVLVVSPPCGVPGSSSVISSTSSATEFFC